MLLPSKQSDGLFVLLCDEEEKGGRRNAVTSCRNAEKAAPSCLYKDLPTVISHNHVVSVLSLTTNNVELDKH